MTILWPVLVLASIVGWGTGVGWVLHRAFGLTLRSLADRILLGVVAVVLAIGLALVTQLAGALGPIIGLVIGTGIVLGLLVGVPELLAIPADDRAGAARVAAIGAGAIGAVAVYAASSSVHFEWNPCDDQNYLYLARRLVLEGDLADPGNLRRIQSPGGMSALQALYLDQLSNHFLLFADRFLGSALLLAALWRTRAGRWAPWGILAAAIVIIAFPTLAGLDSNTSPVMLPAAITLMTMGYLLGMRRDEDPRAATGYGVLLGLLVATGLTLRPQVGQSLAILVAVLLVWPPFRALFWRRAGGVVAGGLIGLVPWAVVSWRDAATPLFPLLPGNTDPSFPVLADRLVAVTVPELVGRVAEALVSPLWLAVLLVGLGALLDARRRHPEQRYQKVALQVFLAALGTCAVWLVAMTLVGWNFGRPASLAIPRYFAPLFLGVALSPFLVFDRAPGREDARTRTWSQALVLTIAAMCVLGSSYAARGVGDTVTDLASGSLLGALQEDKFAAQRDDYEAAVASLPPGSRVFSAVDLPDRLLRPDRSIHTLDMVGFASVPPHLQYFSGDEAKTQWLRDHGYQYLVAMAPGTSTCLYNNDLFEAAANDSTRAAWGRPWQPYVKDWSDYVDHLQRAPGARRIGPLVVVPIT